MGVYHCDCGETLCGETFDCQVCGKGGGDGTIFCESCAEACCASAADKEASRLAADAGLLDHVLDGVYTDTSKFAREKSIQSETVRSIHKRVIADAGGVKDILDAADARPRKAAKVAGTSGATFADQSGRRLGAPVRRGPRKTAPGMGGPVRQGRAVMLPSFTGPAPPVPAGEPRIPLARKKSAEPREIIVIDDA